MSVTATACRDASSELTQPLYKAPHPPIHTVKLDDEKRLARPHLKSFLNNSHIGLAADYKSGHLVHLALATSRDALLIRIAPDADMSRQRLNRALLGKLILLNPSFQKIAFNLDRLALALHYDMNLKINNGVDVLTLGPETDDRTSLHAVVSVLGDSDVLHVPKVRDIFQNEKDNAERKDYAVFRAWAAWHVARLKSTELMAAKKIHTSMFQNEHLDFLAMLSRCFFELEALKPVFKKNDIDENTFLNDRELFVTASRFKTRFKVSGSQSVSVELEGRDNKTLRGHVATVQGRSASISTNQPIPNKAVHAITTIGKEASTNAESQKANIILKTLQGHISLFQNPIVCHIWFPGNEKPNSQTTDLRRHVRQRSRVTAPLNPNPSQCRAIESMLRPCPEDDTVQVTVVQGPPGSGKTSVVAGFVQAIQGLSKAEYGEVVYLVAQSNIAVKNMAEKLAESDFMWWKLIVSREFHFDWHEHLYEKLGDNVVESSQLPQTLTETERLFRDTCVILCTLSMLSNGRLVEAGLLRLFPPRTLIVDEASQIEVGAYLPVFHNFEKTLRRICFVGDDKQLPPYGQEDIPEIQSIFEIQHHRRNAIFLNTQYRMPRPIGEFISRAVYDNRLKTSHSITSKTCCRFIDVGGDETKDGHSWKNMREIQIVVHLVRQALNKGENFRVITPYDAQRSALEDALKRAKLPWEDRCFNVDSFQGNEADHVIVSIVRTERPGFLNNKRRTNVMLTRCKKKMTICSNREFLEQRASTTLVGRMAVEWGGWSSWRDVVNGGA